MEIIFENEHLIAADKPHCVLTTPARDKNDPRRCLGLELQRRAGQQIYPVHRLDFEVSGLVLFAKNPEAHRIAQKWFEAALVVKTYQAVAESGAGPSEWEEWRSKLVRGKRRSFEAPHGSLAITRARVTDVKRGTWELQPVTGRPHQLRVEMAKHRAPICGDTLYGAKAVERPGIALRAVRLDLTGIAERLGLPDVLEASALMWP